MDQLKDIMTLAEAAEELGLAAVTLRAAVSRGTLRARLIGKTYVTTRDEVARYRREHLGKVGRPGLLDQRPAFEDVLGRPDEPNILR